MCSEYNDLKDVEKMLDGFQAPWSLGGIRLILELGFSIKISGFIIAYRSTLHAYILRPGQARNTSAKPTGKSEG